MNTIHKTKDVEPENPLTFLKSISEEESTKRYNI
jgi:hypothetical protein